MATLQTIFLLMFAAVLLVGIAQKLRLPYPITLVLGGTVIGFLPGLPAITFDPNTILMLVLPPILYYAAFGTAFREFQRNWKNIFSLALGLVTFTTCIIGLIFKWLFPEYPWALAFAFGAIVSPPDAISATTILKRFPISPRLLSLLEGESLINDASAIVLYKLAIVALLSGTFSLAEGGLDLIQNVLGGAALGILSGFVLQTLSRMYLGPVIGVVFSFTIPYATYILANTLNMSGVIAVVINGLIGARILVSHQSSLRRVLGYATWDVFMILLNCFVFILIGLQLKNITSTMTMYQLAVYSGYALLMALVMVIVRFMWVYASSWIAYMNALYHPSKNRIYSGIFSDAVIISWSGMRGIVSLAIALGLPYAFPDGSPIEGRNQVVFITFVVILATLLIPGLSLPSVIRWLKIEHHSNHDEMLRIRRQLRTIAEENLQQFAQIKSINETEFGFLQTYFLSHHHMFEMSHASGNVIRKVELIRQEIIQLQRKHLIEMWKRQEIDDIVLTHLEQELDLAEVHIARAQL